MGRTFQIDNLAGTDKKVRSGMLFVAAILSTQQMLKREKEHQELEVHEKGPMQK